jgi:hypothetical protein
VYWSGDTWASGALMAALSSARRVRSGVQVRAQSMSAAYTSASAE